MIDELRLANFKSWKAPKPIQLRAITGLFGANSSGKTSVLQVLLLLKQTSESLDRSRVLHLGDDRSLVDLGTFFDVVYAHETKRDVRLGLSWTLDEPLEIEDPATKQTAMLSSSAMTFDVAISEQQRGGAPQLLVDQFVYQLDSAAFGMKRQGSDRAGETGESEDRYDLVSKGIALKRKRGRPWPLPPPVKGYGFPDQALNYFQDADFLDDLGLEFEELMATIHYLGPLREIPHRSYVWGGERPSDVGSRGERAIEALLAASSEKRKLGRGEGQGRRYVRFERRIAEWLKQMGLIDSFVVRSIGRYRKEHEVRVRKTAKSPEVLLPDVGFGVSQVFPVLVQCYYVPEGSILLFEQPEIHLHPSVQADLADVFIDAVQERDLQIIVESHSEHFVRRLQRRIAEEKNGLGESDVGLYFTNTTGEGSQLTRLQLDSYGNIKNWPDGFFGDQLGDLTAMNIAAADREK